MVYPLLLALHNLNRWLVSGVGIWSALFVTYGWLSKRLWTSQHTFWVRLFAWIGAVQFVLGLFLYLLPGAFIQSLLQNMAWAQIMKDRLLRFFTLEHPTTMLIAIVVANIAAATARRVERERERFAWTAILLILALVLILGTIPWPGSSYARPWLRWPF